MRINRLSDALAAEITGLQVSALDAASMAIARDAFHEHSVIVFRDQTLTPEEHIAFSRNFGDLAIHISTRYLLVDHPEILVLSNGKVDGDYIGGSRMLTGVSIINRYPGHATQAGHIASQCHAGAYAGKWVIVTDEDIDVTNLEELIWAALMCCDPATEMDIIRNAWTSNADPRLHPDEKARGNTTNSRLIIDATKPFHWRDRFPPSTKPRPEVLARAFEKFGHLA